MLLPIAVPTTLPSAEVAATRVPLSACATVTIDDVAINALANQIFIFILQLHVLFTERTVFLS
ncbi:hypothetical protein D3C86_2083370 [compost metagenome]